MSTTREATGEPRTVTEAGRRLIRTTYGGRSRPHETFGALNAAVVAIEAEARNAALVAVEAIVEGLRTGTDHDANDDDIVLSQVSAAIAHLRQGEPT